MFVCLRFAAVVIRNFHTVRVRCLRQMYAYCRSRMVSVHGCETLPQNRLVRLKEYAAAYSPRTQVGVAAAVSDYMTCIERAGD